MDGAALVGWVPCRVGGFENLWLSAEFDCKVAVSRVGLVLIYCPVNSANFRL